MALGTSFLGSVARIPSHATTPWTRFVIAGDSLELRTPLRDPVVFRREDVARVEVERYRNPFMFRTLIWVANTRGRRHKHAFVPFRSKTLIEALKNEGWPVAILR